MSLLMLVAVFGLGVVCGPIVLLSLAPSLPASIRGSFAKALVKTGIRMGKTWLLIERRTGEYVLEAGEYDDDAKAVVVGDEDDEQDYYEDPSGLMGRLFGKNFGIAYEDASAIVNPVSAKVAEEYGAMTDGGELAGGETLSVEDMRERSVIGRITGQNRLIEFVNPFTTVPNGRTLVDVRHTVALLKNAGTPETPRRTADNARRAAEAHRTFGDLKQQVGLLAAFMAGAIACYIGVSAGGGGGGSISGGISLMQTATQPLLLSAGVV
ncbi:hypothetical protein [Halomarina pelagica]|uniref:hypothetical protein n=1 Tax=Halomarina pelagica TaxID=2961599 RepID=UPI0020C3351F|nr:hypothetical protein [Halomarina sp. BND7]